MRPRHLFLLLLLVPIVSCGTCAGLSKTLKGINDATAQMTKRVTPQWDDKCMAEAKSCKVKKLSKENCPGYLKCRDDRRKFYAAVNSIHSSIEFAIGFIKIGKEAKAQDIAVKVAAALERVYKLATDAGFTIK